MVRRVYFRLVLSALTIGACSAGPGGGSDAGPPDDAAVEDGAVGRDTGSLDSGRADSGLFDAGPPPPLGKGGRWVRSHPMFISGLVVSMGAPPAAYANAYFDDFGANAIHLWQDGLGPELDGWQAGRPGAPWITWTLPDGSSQAGGGLLGGYATAPAGRIGYQVSDEPNDMADLLAIEAGAASIRARDPDALIILNFGGASDGSGPFEGGELDAMIDYAGENGVADILSHDNYSRRRSSYAWLERYRDAGLAYGLPYWRYIKSYMNADESPQTESDMRWQALVGLVYGYTGHSWFLYQVATVHALTPTLFDAPGSFSATRTPRFAWAATLNRELANYGRVLTQLRSVDVRYVADVASSAPARTRLWTPGAGGDRYLARIDLSGGLLSTEASVGVFLDDAGDRYVMLQNPNHDAATFPLAGRRSIRVRLEFDFASAPAGLDMSRVRELDGRTGLSVDRALDGAGDSRASLEFDLAAGDIFFYKYATGRAFVGL